MENELPPKSRSDPIIMKLDTPVFHSIFTPELTMLSSIFKKYNYELRIAGGAVRDILSGLTPKDLDFATDATPNEMKDMFTQEAIRMLNTKGESHGTITARINDKENFEVTTLRIDCITDGRHAAVKFIKDWKMDANRRDLTINSMFLDLDGSVYDYFYGYEDLQKKKVAFVGHPIARVREDYLRILRYFRFYGRIAIDPDNHDETTIQAIKDHVDGLKHISGERIWSEWYKILEGNYSGELTLKMLECGVSQYIGLPEEPDIQNFQTVYETAMKNQVTLKPATLISALLRDEMEVINLFLRLKFSAFDRDLALFVVNHREMKPCEKPIKPYQWLVISSNKQQVTKTYVSEVLKYRGAMELLNEFDKWTVPRFPVNGNALIELVPKRKLIGKVMIKLKELWLDANFTLTADELTYHVPDIVNELEKEKS